MNAPAPDPDDVVIGIPVYGSTMRVGSACCGVPPAWNEVGGDGIALPVTLDGRPVDGLTIKTGIACLGAVPIGEAVTSDLTYANREAACRIYDQDCNRFLRV